MNWDSIGAIGEIVGAAAVVLSLIYVGRQIRQSANATRAESFQVITNTVIAMNQSLDEEMIEIVWKATSDEPLDDRESKRYLVLLINLVRLLEAAHYQIELEVLPRDRLPSIVGQAGVHLKSPAGRAMWKSTRGRYSPTFQAFVDDLIAQSTADTLDPLQQHIERLASRGLES